jgi:hypothetical protein
LHSKLFQPGQNQLTLFQAIAVRPKPTSSVPSHSSQAKTNYLHSNREIEKVGEIGTVEGLEDSAAKEDAFNGFYCNIANNLEDNQPTNYRL